MQEIPKQVKEFFARVIPEQYRNGDNIAERGRLLVDDEYLTPNEILINDPFFNKLRPICESSENKESSSG